MFLPKDQMPDEELADRTLSGDTQAFGVLARRHRMFVLRLATRLTANESDAEEVTQEALLNAFRGLPSFRRNGKFSTWLYRITTNTALMRLRAGRYRRTETLDDVAEDVENESSQRSEELLARRQLADSIGNALNRLHPRYRQAFVLREVEERSVSEVAKILSLSHSATRQRVYRARLMLRGYLARIRDAS